MSGLGWAVHTLPVTCTEVAAPSTVARVHFGMLLYPSFLPVYVLFIYFWPCSQAPAVLASGPGRQRPKLIFHFAGKHCEGLSGLPSFSAALPNSGSRWHPNVYCEGQDLGRAARLSPPLRREGEDSVNFAQFPFPSARPWPCLLWADTSM